MKIPNRIFRKVLSWVYRYQAYAADQRLIHKIRNSYSKLSVQKKLSNEQKQEIQEYFKALLGHEVPIEWHQYFYSRTGNYSKLYIPNSEYKHRIIGRLNVYPLHLAYNDKNMTDITLPHTHQPKIYVKNMGGYFYAEGQPITKEEAIHLCRDLGDVIIKPSLTGRGNGVRKIHIEDGIVDNKQALEELFQEYFADYLVQQVIVQHPDMRALNPTSVNTIRILSYRSGMEVLIIYSVVRIGHKGAVIDNQCAGGISTIIDMDGKLGKTAYGGFTEDGVVKTDTGVVLDGYKVPSYNKAIEMVKQSHMQLPYFNMIGWDIAIEEDGTPVMIELNLNPDLSQSAYGPAFGEYTEMILKDAMSRKNSWTPMTMRCMNMRNYPL